MVRFLLKLFLINSKVKAVLNTLDGYIRLKIKHQLNLQTEIEIWKEYHKINNTRLTRSSF